jgi:hypothetical protein
MRKKTYNVKVKMIYETELMVSEKSVTLALIKVSKVLNDCIENKVDLSKTFDNDPIFKYKVELINNLANK